MDPQSSQQPPPLPVHHMMTVPEKIELTATGGYPSSAPQNRGAQDARYRSMRVPDKITLDSAEEGGGGGREGVVGRDLTDPQGPAVSDGLGRYYSPPQAPGPEPPMPVLLDSGRRVEGRGGRGVQEGYALQDLERRLQSLEQQVHTLRQAVMQQGGRGNTSNQGFGVWPALTFATWLLVPLVVVFMAHYKKLSH